MYLIIGLIIISVNSFAIDWTELEKNQAYKITQNITLEQKERSSSFIELIKGESFQLKETISLDMIKVTMFKLNYQNCPGPEMKTQMEIIGVEGSTPLVEVGVQIEENCILEVYIENNELMTKSIFE